MHPARLVLLSWFMVASLATGALAADDQPYDLAPGDRVGITIFEQPDMSGNYIVEPTGEIDFPLIGPLQVATLTPRELQGELVARFGNGYLQKPVISVRLAELRPVTIVGEVRAPGRYTFINGMTAETALALAGGRVRVTGEETAQRLDLLRTKERLRSLTLAELSQRARKARLEAQVKDAAGFDDLVGEDPRDTELLERVEAGERQILTAEASARDSQTALLAERIRSLDSDIQAGTDQADLAKQQIDILDHQIADGAGLLANGLTRKSPIQDLQREKAKAQADLARVLSELGRSKAALAEANLTLRDVGTTYHNRVAADLQAVRLELEQTESALPLVREDLALRTAQLPFAARDEGEPRILRISRYRKDKIESFDADPTAALRPGDILQVGRGTGGGASVTSDRLPEPGVAGEGARAAAPDGPGFEPSSPARRTILSSQR